MGRVTRMAAFRRKRVATAIGAGFMAGIMLGLALLILSPVLPDDTISHTLIKEVAAARGQDCGIVSVHDGDTFRCDGMKIRLVAASGPVDAPEMPGSPRCEPGRGGWCDATLAARARDRLAELLHAGDMRIECDGHDRHGRALCTAATHGRDAGDTLVSEGLAKIEERWRR